ncbi:LysR family transcriptional regulator substrate-binding protein [Victivallis vadensis]|uniref:LysR family transcriptional regulator substrate-binding protein n=1 Tax=Victivallis vadensis TaxID=172901 RepID=UPI003AF7B163
MCLPDELSPPASFAAYPPDITERLDNGTLDFGLLIQPADVVKYDFVNLPATDVRGVLMRKDHPLAQKEAITRRDLLEVPLICSRKFLQQLESGRNDCVDWFGKDFEKLNIVAVYNLVYNATLMVEEGLGCALSLDGLVNVSGDSPLCFRPLSPPLESKLNLVWKKYQLFSKAAEVFLERIQERFGEP